MSDTTAPPLQAFLERVGVSKEVLALSIARFGDSMGNSILFVILPLFVAKLPDPALALSESLRVGVLIALFGIINAIFQPMTGVIGDRLGRSKPLILVGLVVMALGTVLFSFADRYVVLLVMRTAQGVGLALTIPTSLSLMSRLTEKKTRGSAMGVYTTLRLIGFSLGPVLGGYLHDHFGFNAAFYAGALAIGVGFLVVLFLVHETVPETSRQKKERLRFIDTSILTPTILSSALAIFAMASSFTMITTLETQINARVDQTAFAFGVVFSILMVSRLVFQFPLGHLSDRIGRKKLIIGGLLVLAPGTALLGVAHTTGQLAVLRFIQGLGSAGVAAPALALVGDTAKQGSEGRQTSMVTMGFGLGLAFGPLVAGFLGTYDLQLPFFVGGALLVVAAAVGSRFIVETVERR